ncbi:fungal-specific transcription factor domain-containing protein [Biscogniauxia mediterranea]|nr:fungal-specific transcription factor domain-containing protein [Biscogniauxia mediterranea]
MPAPTMTSVPATGGKRKHITTACVCCRESKVKCDGASPTCSNCKNKGKECRYQAGDDKRKLSLRIAIELLSGRVDQLYQFIYDNGLEPPPMDKEGEAVLMRVLDNVKLSHAFPGKDNSSRPSIDNNSTGSRRVSIPNPFPNSPSSPAEAVETTDAQPEPSQSELFIYNSRKSESATGHPPSYDGIIETNMGIDSNGACSRGPLASDNQALASFHAGTWNWVPPTDMALDLPMPNPEEPHTTIGNIRGGPSGSPAHSGSVRLPSCPSQPDESFSDSENTEDLVNLLADRVGSLQIGPDGQVRYYGPTSNFNLVEMPVPDNLTVHRTIRNDGQDCLDRLGIGREVPPELEEHLVNLYFAWQDPTMHVVDRKLYEEAKIRWRDKDEDTPYYSEALRNSICALGAAFETRHHPSFVTFPRSLADFFADRAKALLEIELDCPCLATVQAMVVLSGHDIGCKRDARGWLYSGMAIRLAFDLSLHLDLAPYVARGSISQAEAALRQTVFWGAYATDHAWSFYLGRPFRINTADVTVAKLGTGPNGDSIGQWIPYVSPKSFKECSPLLDPTDELSRKRALLWDIIVPLGDSLYGRHTVAPETARGIYERTVQNLINWKDSLGASLQVDLDDQDKPYLPHVLLLHMQYHQTIIHTHRPWMSSTYLAPEPQGSSISTNARMKCVDSAVAIAKLLQLYESRYTLRRMNIQAVGITCSAALLLIFAVRAGYKGSGGNELGQHLSACFRALDEFSSSWENAKKARDFLALLQRQWENRGRPRRLRRNMSLADSLERKRTRTDSFDSQSRTNQRMSPPQQQQQQQQQSAARMRKENQETQMGIDLDWIFTGYSDTLSNPFLGLQS